MAKNKPLIFNLDHDCTCINIIMVSWTMVLSRQMSLSIGRRATGRNVLLFLVNRKIKVSLPFLSVDVLRKVPILKCSRLISQTIKNPQGL